MKKYRMAAAIITVCLTAAMLAGCKVGDKEIRLEAMQLKNNKTVFKINDYKCDIKYARLYFCNYRNLYGQVYGIELWKQADMQEGLENYAKSVAVEELSRIACMNLLAKQDDMELSSEEQKKAEECAKEYYESLNKEEKKYIGADQGDIRTAYEDYALAQKLYATLTEGTDEEVSDDEARVIRVQQVVTKDSTQAEAMRQKLADGEEFESAAASCGQTDNLEAVVARGEYPQEVEEVAFNLDDGESSSMIEADGEYYFIYCLNKYEEELTEKNKEVIRMSREEERFENTYKSFVDAAEFQFNNELWSEVTLKDTEGITTDSFFSVYRKYFS